MDVKAEGRPPVQPGEHGTKIYSRALGRTLRVNDAREQAARASGAPRAEELRAFLESKRNLVRSHARLTPSQKARALAEIDQIEESAGGGGAVARDDSDSGGGEGGDDEPPLPGGVGLGVFYDAAYKISFDTGTTAEFFVLCPTRPGGNVHSFLYLTAMNRASQGAEALIAYHAQDDLRFIVFDWARAADPWQTDMSFPELAPYLRERHLYGAAHQCLLVMNFTIRSGPDRWTNGVYLHNAVTGELDRIYTYEYACSTHGQKVGWNGSWGPILETFQNRYEGTRQLGFAEFGVAACRDTEWEPWELLSPGDTYVQHDDVGFRILHLEPNHTFVAAA